MKKYITLMMLNGDRLHIIIDHISGIRELNNSCYVLLTSGEYYAVKESFEQIKNKIDKV